MLCFQSTAQFRDASAQRPWLSGPGSAALAQRPRLPPPPPPPPENPPPREPPLKLPPLLPDHDDPLEVLGVDLTTALREIVLIALEKEIMLNVPVETNQSGAVSL